ATETTDKPTKAKRIKRSISRKTRQPKSSPKSVGASEAEEVPAEEPQSDNKEESEKVVLGAEEGGQDEGQPGPDPDAQAEDQTKSDAGAQADGQAGPDPGDAEAKVQSTLSPVVHAGSDREHIDLDVADASPQPSTEQLDEGFTATVYPSVQENLKLAVEEPVLLEEPASSLGTLSSLQHLSKDFSFGDQFFSYKHSDADKNAEIEVESIVIEVVTDAVDWAMQAPLRNCFRDLPEANIKEILHQRMWESDSYKSHKDHMQLFEALEKSMNRDHFEELTQDLAEARKKKKKSRESPKTPPGSPSHQPPPPPPPAGSAAPSRSKTAASAEYQAWTTTNIKLRPVISLTPVDLEMDEDRDPDEQTQSSDGEDIRSAHIPTVNLRQGWWKPFEEERPTTLEPAWSIRSSDVPVPTNN
nr:hypothetical protein [Tanacetum cinerariifolium]